MAQNCSVRTAKSVGSEQITTPALANTQAWRSRDSILPIENPCEASTSFCLFVGWFVWYPQISHTFPGNSTSRGFPRSSPYSESVQLLCGQSRGPSHYCRGQSASQPLLTKISIVSTNLQPPTRHYTGFMLLISLFRRYIYWSFPSYIMRLSSVHYS